MKYTQQQIEGNVLQLILEKVNAAVKPLEENLTHYLIDPARNEDIIKLIIEAIMGARENTFAMYGVKPQRLGKI